MNAPKVVPTPSIEDVSEAMADLNPCDRVYRTESGYLVKVKTQRLASADPATLHLRLSGAVAATDGKALRLEDGAPFVGAPHVLTVHAESEVDVGAVVEAERQTVVRRMELAAIHHDKARALKGVGFA